MRFLHISLPLLAGVLATTLSTTVAHAQLIDITTGTAGQGPGVPTGGAVLGSTGDKWDAITNSYFGGGEPYTLTNTAGLTTNVKFFESWDGTNYDNGGGAGDLNPALMENFWYRYNANGDPTTAGNPASAPENFSGLADNTEYNVVFYTLNDKTGGDFNLAVNGTTYTLLEDPNAAYTSDSVLGSPTIYSGNYIEITAESSATGTLDFTLSAAATNTSGYYGISGIQLEAAAVPEPGTYALMLGGLGLLYFMQRRRLVA